MHELLRKVEKLLVHVSDVLRILGLRTSCLALRVSLILYAFEVKCLNTLRVAVIHPRNLINIVIFGNAFCGYDFAQMKSIQSLNVLGRN